MRKADVVDLVDSVASVAFAPTAIAAAYLGVLAVAANGLPRSPHGVSIRFVVVVPAHNEELSIGSTVRDLAQIDYPASLFRIVVVADNSTDGTAREAEKAGAEVLTRNDPSRRGKGYALEYAFDRLLNDADRPVDAVVVVDADTTVSPNLLRAFAGRLAAGESALQASYQVANGEATWRTALMSVAFACMHDVRSVGRERLGLSTGLRGNGMCFSVRALREVPHRATSLVEDVEHGLDLAAANIRVAFVHDAWVKAEMPEHSEEASSQRQRWERGRSKLRRERLTGLVSTAVGKRDLMTADLAADLAIPPLATLALAVGASSAAASGISVVSRNLSKTAVVSMIGIVGLGGHVAKGWKVSGTGTSGLHALLHVPRYILWKLGLAQAATSSTIRVGNAKKDLGNGQPGAEEWIRTTRNAEVNPPMKDRIDV